MTHQVLNRHIKKAIRHGSGHRFFGIILAFLGVFWIAKNAGWITGTLSIGVIFWPLALCFLGVFMIAGIKNRK